MAKFERTHRLDKQTAEELITDLCEAITVTKSPREAAELITDLLGQQELEMVAKRLRIAELLLDNRTYNEIRRELMTSFGTIARVQAWLQNAGDGYRAIAERTRKRRENRQENQKPLKLRGMKRKYPMHYWPQIIFEYWIKNSTQKEKEDMRKILAKVNTKTQVYRELEKLLR